MSERRDRTTDGKESPTRDVMRRRPDVTPRGETLTLLFTPLTLPPLPSPNESAERHSRREHTCNTLSTYGGATTPLSKGSLAQADRSVQPRNQSSL